jgi:hypothetical protein
VETRSQSRILLKIESNHGRENIEKYYLHASPVIEPVRPAKIIKLETDINEQKIKAEPNGTAFDVSKNEML